jgi:SPX domain protein involved in polyphosphate accumulation
MDQLSHNIRRFNRFELKYLVNLKQAESIQSELGAYLSLDENGNSNGTYPLISLYYDSPDLRCFWEKMDGIKYRRKLRIRYYGEQSTLNDEKPVFLEIKQRLDRVTQKRRAILPLNEAMILCNERQIPDHAPADDAVIQEIAAFVWQYNLRPTSIIRYQRRAYVGTRYDLGLRITFDTNVTCQSYPPSLDKAPTDFRLLPPDCVVMEIKVNERIPYWLTELIAIHNLKVVRISKYCCSVECIHLNPENLGILS